MISAMGASIDAAGRLVIPKAIREEAGLLPGQPLEIRLVDGHIEIEAKPRNVRIEKDGDLYVAVSDEPSKPLTLEMLNRTLERIRSHHALRAWNPSDLH